MLDQLTNAPVAARGAAIVFEISSGHMPPLTNPPETAGADAMADETPTLALHQRDLPASAGDGGHSRTDTHLVRAPIENSTGRSTRDDLPSSAGEGEGPKAACDPLKGSASPVKSRRKTGGDDQISSGARCPVVVANPSRSDAGQQVGGQTLIETHGGQASDLRWTDPTVAQIVQLHRMRRRWMKAKNALILQGKAFGRAVCDGDKDAGSAAYDRVMAGKMQPGDEVLAAALIPFGPAIAQFDTSIAPIEKQLAKLAKALPIAPWVESVTGLGWGSVAAIVGEAGDLSAYPSVAGVWKRMGLAVIDGDGRQRRVADAERAIAHGYNPERRAVVWVMADSMSKLQRTWIDKDTGEVKKPAGPYGEILEREKAKALEAGLSKAHAEARGKRHMSKAVLRDMTVEWRRAVGRASDETHQVDDDCPLILEAAE